MAPLRQHDMRLRSATTDEVREVWEERWYGLVVCLNTVYEPGDVEGLALVDHLDELVGLVTYHIDGDQCELVTIDSLCQFMGIGSMLLEKVEEVALKAGCRKIWAITTNDNLDAHRFFQKRGFTIRNVRLGGMTKIRLLKPNVPKIGYYEIPIRDEIEFEKPLDLSY